ncbi:MAG: autotransporter-associated beta strand repeat-containing protein [Phycisphaerales bacterium]|nr:autotransporter-associated beta strand repeat-containing protein [Phycisphaerales bacterium]
MRSKRSIRILRVVGVALAASPALADQWDNSAGNALWATASNWVDNTAPTINDFALFPNTIPGGQSIITCPTNTFALSLNFLNSYTLIGGNIQLGNGMISGGGWSPIIRSHLTGAGPFTFSGGTISLFPISSNSYTGGTIISGSSTTVVVTTNAALGFSTAPITLNGGRLRLDGEFFNPPFIMSRDITLGTGGGTIDLINNAFLDLARPLAATANLLTLTGTGGAEFSSASTRSGNTTINGPFVRLRGAQALGAGTITVFGTGVLELANGLTYTMPTGLGAGATLQGGAGTNTYNGSCNVFGTSVTIGSGPTTSDSLILGSNGASVWNNGGATRIAQGTVRLLSANNYVGSWTIDAGLLEVAHVGALGAGTTPIIVNSPGRLRLNIPTLARDITLNNPGGGIELLQDATVTGHIPIAPNAGFVPILGTDHEFTLAGADSSMSYTGTAYFGGASGVGSMRVIEGADVTGDSTRVIGTASGPARLTVNGAGSTWQNTGETWIGASDNPASLFVEAGGSFYCPHVYVGQGADGSASVTDEGSLLTCDDLLVIGFAGAVGALDVLDGADVSVGQMKVGELTGSSGTLTVSGAGSTLAAQPLSIGLSAAGALSVTNGGQVTCQSLVCGDGSAALGTVTISGALSRLECNSGPVLMSLNGAASTLNLFGGVVDINGDLTDSGTGLSTLILDEATLDMHNFTIGAGPTPIDALQFRSGTLRNVAEINNGAGLSKTSAGTLTLDGVNTYTGLTSVSDGTLTLAASQNLQFLEVGPAGRYRVTLAGSMMGADYPSLSLSGQANLDGSLDIALASGYEPNVGDSFVILTFGSRLGAFANVTGLSAGSGKSFDVAYNPDNVTLTVIIACPGDLDGDGVVTLADLSGLLANFGVTSGASPSDGDIDADGDVDLGDLSGLLGNFGVTCE